MNGGETWSNWYNQPTGQFYHVVGPLKINWIGIGERVGARAVERLDTVVGATIAAATGVLSA